MTTLYSLRTSPAGEFTILKFDRDYNLQSCYALSAASCTCPQGERGKPCRHRKILPEFIAKGHTNDGWFLDWDTRLWRGPIGEAASAASPLELEATTNEAASLQASEAGEATASERSESLEQSREALHPNGKSLYEQEQEAFEHTQAPPPSPEAGAFSISGVAPAPEGGGGTSLASPSPPLSFKRRKVA